MNYSLTAGEARELILAKLSHNFGVSPIEASNEHFYKAVVLVVKDIMTKNYNRFMEEAEIQGKKQIYYLCMEFLMGRSLKNNLYNLGIEKIIDSALKSMNIKLENIYEEEPDAGLGNAGLGRLAACFLDGLATQGYPAMGYSLRYEYGVFRQKLVDGWQTELPEFWLPGGSVWLQVHQEKSIEVLFDGEIKESWEGEYHSIKIENATKVLAVPYDLMVSGKDGKGVSRLRLWAAKSSEFDMSLFNGGEYIRAMEQNAMAEVITKVLYPEDNHQEGKSLRLTQQYFLVSATIQDIIKRHLRKYCTLDNLPDLTAIHLNDTHPVLAIPELMRIMLDDCGYNWDTAWDIAVRTVSYTNHNIVRDSLECWGENLIKRRLPRIYQILFEINKRYCAKLIEMNIEKDKISRMAIISDGVIKIANLAVAGSHSVNGVSKLHTQTLKDTVFNDFYTVNPDKFKNITNGIAHRRWLNQANPKLADFITELIGSDFIYEAQSLEKLMNFKNDNSVIEQLQKIKLYNKTKMAEYIKANNGIIVDPNSIFDVQVKRLHEYKRQHLNALHILSLYQWLRENPNAEFTPKTYIFGAKAAPGYYFAKQIIRFIVDLSNQINNDKRVNQKLKVIYLEDYKVTVAEKLVPAADISEQISVAGSEASGTGNMKLMINGAITLGTNDGANVEIRDAVGDENIIMFGMKPSEVNSLKKSGYNPMVYYNNNIIKNAVDEMAAGFGKNRYDDISRSLTGTDNYMVLADFEDYANAQKKASQLYNDKTLWGNMSLTNIANAGIFAIDRVVREYAEKVWNTTPVK